MNSTLNWSKYDVANTATHSYRIETIGSSVSVIYSKLPDGQAMQYNDLDSKQAAKQWAENYNNEYGASV